MRRKLAVLIVIFVLSFAMGSQIDRGLSLFNFAKDKAQQARDDLLAQGKMTILLLGIDARPGEKNTRTDTMILAVVDMKEKKMALVSIPRDTRVKDGDGYRKINSFNAIGGPRLAKEKVEELMGIPVNYYVCTNFAGFKDIVDTLGGVTINVEKRMYKPSEGINLKPGVQRLDGAGALAYCRFRGDALGDIGRTERQQKFLRTLAREMMQAGTIAKLPRLVPELNKYVDTDIPVSKMYTLAKIASNFDEGSMVAQTLPGYFYDDPATGASYWVADETKIAGLVDKLLGGQTVEVIEDSPVAASGSKKTGSSSRKSHTGTAQAEEPPASYTEEGQGAESADGTGTNEGNSGNVTTEPGIPVSNGDSSTSQNPAENGTGTSSPSPEQPVDGTIQGNTM